jgi:hypothetical protein
VREGGRAEREWRVLNSPLCSSSPHTNSVPIASKHTHEAIARQNEANGRELNSPMVLVIRGAILE